MEILTEWEGAPGRSKLMFEHLPETFPEQNKEKKSALFGAATLHIVAVLLLLTIPLWTPYETMRPEFVTRLYMPPPPPPAAPASEAAVQTRREARPPVHSDMQKTFRIFVSPHRAITAQRVSPIPICTEESPPRESRIHRAKAEVAGRLRSLR